MSETVIELNEKELAALSELARRTGKTENELLREAVTGLIGEFQYKDRRTLLQQARGIWKDRNDLPDWISLRRELDRF